MWILGLGSNLGDRLGYLRRAIHLLKSLKSQGVPFEIETISPIYESEALLPPDAPSNWNLPFLNLALKCQSALSPGELLREVKAIEEKMGRIFRGHWAPREIDIDLLALGQTVITEERLSIPHRSLMERPFAVLPMADLLPEWIHPGSGPYSGMSLQRRISQWREESAQGDLPFGTQRSQKTFTELMGISNLTPDSFSDGGELSSHEAFLNRTTEWVHSGIRIFDLGAESTRPGATFVSAEEEITRLTPHLHDLKTRHTHTLDPVLISIDTRHPKTARWAIQQGAHWINDVSGLSHPDMIEVIADSNCDAVFMHSLSVPADRHLLMPAHLNPVDEILNWAERRLVELSQKGIARERLIFDPGIGFGKTLQQNWQILKECHKFHALGVRILIGHSRKSFLNVMSSKPFRDRDVETASLSIHLCGQGIDYLRVHHPILNQSAMTSWSLVQGVASCRA